MSRASLVSLGILAILLLFSLGGSIASEARVAQLLTNPGFEDGLTGWTVSDCPSSECTWSLITTQSAIVYEGSYAAYLAAQAPLESFYAWQSLSQYLPYSPSEWVFSVYVYVDARACPGEPGAYPVGDAMIAIDNGPEYVYALAEVHVMYCDYNTNDTHAKLVIYTGYKYPSATVFVPEGWIHITVEGNGAAVTVYVNGEKVVSTSQLGDPVRVILAHKVQGILGYTVYDSAEFWDISSLG